jgi:hypothetical protein
LPTTRSLRAGRAGGAAKSTSSVGLDTARPASAQPGGRGRLGAVGRRRLKRAGEGAATRADLDAFARPRIDRADDAVDHRCMDRREVLAEKRLLAYGMREPAYCGGSRYST